MIISKSNASFSSFSFFSELKLIRKKVGQENFLFKRYYQDYAQIYTKMGFYQVRKPETYSELCQTFKTKLFFATIVNG